MGRYTDDAAQKERPAFQYTISSLARAVRLSRSAIRYYRDHGVIGEGTPDAQGAASYSRADYRRLMCAITLHNIGLSIEETVQKLDNDAMSDAHVNEYIEMLSHTCEVAEAQAERLRFCLSLRQRLGEVSVEVVEPYRFMEPFMPDAPQPDDAQPPALPLAGLAMRFRSSTVGKKVGLPEPCRAVPSRYVHLASDFEHGVELGGCLCATVVVHMDEGDYEQEDLWGILLDGLRDKVHALGYLEQSRANEEPFCPACFLTDEGAYWLLCLPVEDSRGRVRRLIERLREKLDAHSENVACGSEHERLTLASRKAMGRTHGVGFWDRCAWAA